MFSEPMWAISLENMNGVTQSVSLSEELKEAQARGERKGGGRESQRLTVTHCLSDSFFGTKRAKM